MEWQHIIGFYQVAKLRSFTKAAEVTLRTQSALSQQIKSLEDQLGCQLFERIGRRKIKLTSAGERFLKFAESVLEGYDNLKEDLAELQVAPKGPLKIAAPFTTFYHLLPAKLKKYMELFPQVELTLLDRPQKKVVGLVKEGEADFGLALESIAPKELATIRWRKVDTVLLVPPGHPLTHSKRIALEQIAKYPLILPPKNIKYSGRTLLEKRLRELGAGFRVAMESSNVELSASYVEMGLGISFASIVKELPGLTERKLHFIDLGHHFPPDHIAVMMRKDQVLPPYKKALLNVLFE
ncbi:MAG: LysR family transcriptional regulator [Desulforhabdus sp.]|jgi:DNA-binding transcriptional LysR family regulator|nr:LysR family transcriptional regulator [Desulforhabdus sp.]